MSVPLWAWFAVLGVILVMLAVDLVAHRKVDAPRNRPILHPSVLTLRQPARDADTTRKPQRRRLT